MPRRSAPRNDKIRGLSVSVIARRGKAPTWQSVPSSPLPPPSGEVPPQGAERVSPANKKSPGGGLGIDFFPYHVILKIKRGAAGRREPPHKLLSSNRRADQANGGYFFLIWRTREMMATIRIPKSKRSEYVTMTSPPLLCSGGGKEVSASSRRRGLPPTEYWQRQRISMRRRYYSTFCRIWQG